MQNAALAETWTPSGPDVMDITGRLDDGTSPLIEEDALLCIQSGARRMILDCRDLHYITGAGTRALIAIARAMQQAEGTLAVCHLQPQVEAMFRATGIDRIIPVFADQDEATAALAA
ncbi:MAG: STAS domain-containing protein [Bdellovibrionales bacterium]